MVQQEYLYAWALVFLVLFFALLVVCVPRPRAVGLTPADPKAKSAAKRKKAGEKAKKKLAKQQKKKR